MLNPDSGTSELEPFQTCTTEKDRSMTRMTYSISIVLHAYSICLPLPILLILDVDPRVQSTSSHQSLSST